jgi:hypothetical protein
VIHDDAWQRLPDLLDDRDDPELLSHVRDCGDCQRQLFLLGRVDRLLRAQARPQRKRPRLGRIGAASAALVAVAAAAAALELLAPQPAHARAFTLRTASGREVGRALIGRSDARNASLALTANGLPLNRNHVYVLWASDAGRSIEVGPFMVDRNGSCSARFNLPATNAWRRFWVAQPGHPGAVVATS